MPSRLPPNLLDRSAPESARLLGLHYLDQIDRAERRLGRPGDEEALHDFRVGLRRLRSALSAYRGQLEDSVSGKMRRRIKELARATNDGRDAEVQLAWMGKQLPQLAPEDGPGFYWLAGRLEDRKQETHDRAIRDVAGKYHKVSQKLRRALGVLRIELETGQGQPPPTFSEVTATLIRQQVPRLRQDLSLVRDASDAGQLHRTRISLKRLRYLLEPIARRNRRAGALVRLFREAQDLLGEHHDMHILSAAIASLRAQLNGSSFPGLEPGLVTLARRAEEGAQAAYERFHLLWSDDLANWILSQADELGQTLERRSVPVEKPVLTLKAEPAPPPQPRLGPKSPVATETG